MLVFRHIKKSIYWRNKGKIFLILPWLSLEIVDFPDFSLIFFSKTHFPYFSLISQNPLIWQTPCYESSPPIPLPYGCDTVSSFAGRGKLKPLKLLFKNSEYIDAFIFRRRYRTWRRNSKKAWKIRIKYVWEKVNVLHIHQRFAVQHLLSKRRKGIISLATSLSQCAYTTQYVSQLSNVYLATVF